MMDNIRILDSVAKEPYILRWLHSLDPDRHLTPDLLRASASIRSYIPPSQTLSISQQPIPPTSSLFVPMYRRKHFILGQLYGPMSPNAMGLSMLAAAGFGQPPHPIARRFVADLSSSSIDFLEYEWLSDGKLCVTIHHIRQDGLYHGQTILLASSSEPSTSSPQPLTQQQLLSPSIQHRVPDRVIMRTQITEHLACADSSALQSNRPPARLRQPPNEPWHNWHTWIRAMAETRHRPFVQLSLNFSMISPHGVVNGSRDVVIRQDFELASDTFPSASHAPATTAAAAAPATQGAPHTMGLVRMFLEECGMMVNHPMTDGKCRAVQEHRDRREVAARRQSVSVRKASDEDAVEVAEASGEIQPAETPPQVDAVAPAATAASLVQGNEVPIVEGGVSKKKQKTRRKVFQCKCGKWFNHRGHYNEHLLCVHERVRQHRCAYLHCQSRFFKKSDRDRHMKSKHDVSVLACIKCEHRFPSKDAFFEHEKAALCRDSRNAAEAGATRGKDEGDADAEGEREAGTVGTNDNGAASETEKHVGDTRVT